MIIIILTVMGLAFCITSIVMASGDIQIGPAKKDDELTTKNFEPYVIGINKHLKPVEDWIAEAEEIARNLKPGQTMKTPDSYIYGEPLVDPKVRALEERKAQNKTKHQKGGYKPTPFDSVFAYRTECDFDIDPRPVNSGYCGCNINKKEEDWMEKYGHL